MQLRDATRRFGRVVILIPLTLIFLTAADSALACPGHKTKAAYRTRAINTRTVPTTVISYRAPASYRRCGANLYDTRGAKYVAVRNNGSSAKFVAVRNYAPRTRYIAVREYAPRARFVAVRNIDFDDDDLQYVRVRRADGGTRYAAVRSGYRKGNGIVGYVDENPRYVAVERIVPRTRYVAIRDIDIDDDEPRYISVRTVPRTRYVAVRNVDTGCTRAVALRRCLDDVETTSAKRVVLRHDDDGVSMKHVVLRDDIDDDDEYIAVHTDAPKYVEYRDATYSTFNDEAPAALSTRTITYDPEFDDDDGRAFFKEATYVADNDMEDACLLETSPEIVSTRAVSYVPVATVDASSGDTTYIETDDAAPLIRYVALDDDRVFDDVDPIYVAEDVDTDTVSYVPVDDVEVVAAEPVKYVAVDDIDNVDTTYIADDACPISVSSLDAGPVYIADTSNILLEEVDSELVTDLSSTQQIAGHYGYRDGFEDGQEAALERDAYHPENSGDYQKATEGYEDTFGDKDVYKDGYRSSYLRGYRAGFESVGRMA